MISDLVNQLLGFIMTADRQSANETVDRWARVNGYQKAVIEVLEPTLELFGKRWAEDKNISLAQGYIAAKIAEDILTKTSEEKPEVVPATGPKGPVIMGNIEDDFHSLGRKMICIFLRSAGWKVYDLGNDVLAEEFVDKAEEVGARVIGASAMMHLTAVNIAKLRNEIDRRNLNDRVQLAVGGAVFKIRPDLVDKVGGNGTADHAIVVPKLIERLWEKAVSMGG